MCAAALHRSSPVAVASLNTAASGAAKHARPCRFDPHGRATLGTSEMCARVSNRRRCSRVCLRWERRSAKWRVGGVCLRVQQPAASQPSALATAALLSTAGRTSSYVQQHLASQCEKPSRVAASHSQLASLRRERLLRAAASPSCLASLWRCGRRSWVAAALCVLLLACGTSGYCARRLCLSACVAWRREHLSRAAASPPHLALLRRREQLSRVAASPLSLCRSGGMSSCCVWRLHPSACAALAALAAVACGGCTFASCFRLWHEQLLCVAASPSQPALQAAVACGGLAAQLASLWRRERLLRVTTLPLSLRRLAA